MSVKYKLELETHLYIPVFTRSPAGSDFSRSGSRITKAKDRLRAMTLTANSQKHRLSLGADSGTRRAFTGKPVHDLKSDYNTRELFRGQRQIEIHHNDETYRLSITKQGKLILTK
jgi:hemin uptake protein HemP